MIILTKQNKIIIADAIAEKFFLCSNHKYFIHTPKLVRTLIKLQNKGFILREVKKNDQNQKTKQNKEI